VTTGRAEFLTHNAEIINTMESSTLLLYEFKRTIEMKVVRSRKDCDKRYMRENQEMTQAANADHEADQARLELIRSRTVRL
jgi:hypothetical protein